MDVFLPPGIVQTPLRTVSIAIVVLLSYTYWRQLPLSGSPSGRVWLVTQGPRRLVSLAEWYSSRGSRRRTRFYSHRHSRWWIFHTGSYWYSKSFAHPQQFLKNRERVAALMPHETRRARAGQWEAETRDRGLLTNPWSDVVGLSKLHSYLLCGKT